MSDPTPLDAARAAMEAAPDDDRLRMAFYARLAETELSLLLTEEPRADALSPEVFDTAEGRYVLAFEGDEALAAFAGAPAPYAALPGRTLADMLAGQGVGIALNLGAPGGSGLVPPAALDWLAEVLSNRPGEALARPESVEAPRALPEDLLTALDAKLARAAGLARHAYLASVRYDDGSRGHLLAVTGTARGAEEPLARAVNEALIFSGLDAGALDVAFLGNEDPLAARLARVALRFDLPEGAKPRARGERPAPGSDPDTPPKLR
ncbi:hypothetical protein ROJ8625_02428 [Roseivivax jejudonensis]|uniref:SseB protein N-terminal domain-containing protein n=1 Tax=Roseivivax jejudonensis TaxID=1529041 RepID=A0A1X6ZEN4_9RHOB|nr:SseB family protein [Roseivivax jejudonensis]SLN49306.1 hypothetical protein ROJ8625_02428 [Roseivivax jejudonensis]